MKCLRYDLFTMLWVYEFNVCRHYAGMKKRGTLSSVVILLLITCFYEYWPFFLSLHGLQILYFITHSINSEIIEKF
jgi:hypothetical protein